MIVLIWTQMGLEVKEKMEWEMGEKRAESGSFHLNVPGFDSLGLVKAWPGSWGADASAPWLSRPDEQAENSCEGLP